jgi:hypothetical protein
MEKQSDGFWAAPVWWARHPRQCQQVPCTCRASYLFRFTSSMASGIEFDFLTLWLMWATMVLPVEVGSLRSRTFHNHCEIGNHKRVHYIC